MPPPWVAAAGQWCGIGEGGTGRRDGGAGRGRCAPPIRAVRMRSVKAAAVGLRGLRVPGSLRRGVGGKEPSPQEKRRLLVPLLASLNLHLASPVVFSPSPPLWSVAGCPSFPLPAFPEACGTFPRRSNGPWPSASLSGSVVTLPSQVVVLAGVPSRLGKAWYLVLEERVPS